MVPLKPLFNVEINTEIIKSAENLFKVAESDENEED